MHPNQNPEPPPSPPPNNSHHHNPPPDLNGNPPTPEDFEYFGTDTPVEKIALALMELRNAKFPDRKGKGKIPDDDADVINLVSSDEEQEQQEQERERQAPVEIDFLSGFPVDHGQRFVNHGGEQQQEPPPQQLPPRYNPHQVYREWEERVRLRRKQVYKETAKIHALRYARVEPPQDGGGGGSGSGSSVRQTKDGSSPSTPFSLAMEAIEGGLLKKIAWVSRKKPQDVRVSVPSLLELSLKTLADNADSIASLGGVPNELRHRLSKLLCDSSRMNSKFLELLVSGSPTEIRIRDCSWLSEEEFIRCFQSCDLDHLEVLQLDQCGRCISDYVLPDTLAKSPRCLPRVTSLSFSGACRLTDKGLRLLVSSAPVLRSINLSQCALLTPASLNILADSLGSLLKELYLDDFQLTDAIQILPTLKKFKNLEVLSLAGIQAVSDIFVIDYINARGHNMKELVLKDCINLTNTSVQIIAEQCPRLQALDLTNLCKLTDLSIEYLTNNCPELRTLKLCRNPFSDEAIASFLEIIGSSLEELSLNSIRKVGQHTALSLARNARNLHTLDLSWCRNVSDEELGLIVDSCLSLKFLKLFGCSQVTSIFLDGYSNPRIQIIGLKLTPLFQRIEVFDHPQGALRYSCVSLNDKKTESEVEYIDGDNRHN